MGQVKKEDFCVFCREVKPYSVVKKNIRKRIYLVRSRIYLMSMTEIINNHL